MSRYIVLSTLFVAFAVNALVAAEPSKKKTYAASKKFSSNLIASKNSNLPIVSANFRDLHFDFELYSAEPAYGTEWVVYVIFEGKSNWELLGTPQYNATTETAWYSGVRKFSNSNAADSSAEDLLGHGFIVDYFVYERDRQPVWRYEGTYDTRSEAIQIADIIENYTDRITRIDSISAMDFRYEQP